jgi:hypothetical protein
MARNSNGDGIICRPPAGVANGGTPLPASAQAARATCCLAKGTATHCWSFLANNFRGGLFCHFIDAGGLFCQKFEEEEEDYDSSKQPQLTLTGWLASRAGRRDLAQLGYLSHMPDDWVTGQ